MADYSGILILAFMSIGFSVTMVLLATYLGPKFATPTKQLPFECGAVSVGNVQDQRFSVRFYMVAMLFILFDIEVIFLYPWAASILEIGWQGFFHMLAFISVLGLAFAYVWKKGILDWGK